MKKVLGILMVSFIATMASAAVIQQNDFTSAQNGTLPSDISALYDPGVDALVTGYSNVSGVIADHSGGDGYVLRLADLGSTGGGYNWAYVTDYAKATSDSYAEAWVYINLDTTAFTAERDYGLFIRCTSGAALGTSASRNGYMFLITANSAWGTYTPPNFTPFLLKRNGSSGWVMLNQASVTVTNGWHKIKVEAVGTTVKGYVDDVLVAQATDSTFTSGIAGMVYYDDNGSPDYPYSGAFDNFVFGTSDAINDWTQM